jgi:hypothetical protein
MILELNDDEAHEVEMAVLAQLNYLRHRRERNCIVPGDRIATLEALNARLQGRQASFQARVVGWLHAAFGEAVAKDRTERNHRFLEESLELVQALGCTRSETMQLVDYVYDRPVGRPAQEVGGVSTTLAALCNANDIDMEAAREAELARIWGKIDVIRRKQAAKPAHSPLPGPTPPPDGKEEA